jgi:hypothetical protein
MLIMNYKKTPANFPAVHNTLCFQLVTVAKLEYYTFNAYILISMKVHVTRCEVVRLDAHRSPQNTGSMAGQSMLDNINI